MVTLSSICVIANYSDEHHQNYTDNLAEKLGLALTGNLTENRYKYHLVYTDKCLSLQQNPLLKLDKINPMQVNYVSGDRVCSRISTSSIRNPLAKAAGLKPRRRPTIIDATAGLGLDGMTLAYLGCKTTLIERSPILFVLLQNGLHRALQHATLLPVIKDNITLLLGDSIVRLQSQKPDCVLLDPMYPPARKTALQKKEMRILREIVGNDGDSKELFTAALSAARSRVIVKRPKGAAMITHTPRPTIQIPMKSGRFDVYLKAHL